VWKSFAKKQILSLEIKLLLFCFENVTKRTRVYDYTYTKNIDWAREVSIWSMQAPTIKFADQNQLITRKYYYKHNRINRV